LNVELPTNFRSDAFAGTAEAYARYRAPYPRALLDDLVARAGGSRRALIDLATGPGRVALDIADRFDRVVAIDLEPEMVAVGRERAAARGIANIEWRVGRAEDFEAAPASFDLITIGEAFHRLRQSVVASRAFGLLRPGGHLATLGLDGRFEGESEWQATLREVSDVYRALAFPNGWAEVLPGERNGTEARIETFRRAGFTDVEEHILDVPHVWTFDEIAGYLESTSTCSRRALGVHFEPFIAELRTRLMGSGAETFSETIRWGYTLARKPR
jgi:SAM-dependent methyltransferase